MFHTFIKRQTCNRIVHNFSSINNLGAHQTKTKVLLQRLPVTATEGSIRDAVSDLNCRRVEIEPGCAIHFSSEVSAMKSQNIISSKFGCNTMMKATTMPSLMLNNMSSTATIESIKEQFQRYNPKLVRTLSSSGCSVTVNSVDDALAVQTLINSTTLGNNKLYTYASMLPNNKTSVHVYNIPLDISDAGKQIQSMVNNEIENAVVSETKAAPKSLKLRFSGNKNDDEKRAIIEKLSSSDFHGKTPIVKSSKMLHYRKPTLFLRNVACMSQPELENDVMNGLPFERIQMMRKSKDVNANLAVVYFNSEADAVNALHQMKSKPKYNNEGDKVEVSMKFTTEPSVRVSNLPEDVTDDQILKLFERFFIERVESVGNDKIVVLASPRLVELAVESVNNRVIGGKTVSVVNNPYYDCGVELEFPDGFPADMKTDPKELLDSIKTNYNLSDVKSLTVDSNASAVVAFDDIDTVMKAHKNFVSSQINKTTTLGDSVRTKLTTHPSYTVEVTGFPTDKPVSDINNELGNISNDIVAMNRSAIVKFKRNQDVVPGIKKLQAIENWGGEGESNVTVSRYHPITANGFSAYDEKEGMDKFDELMNKDINVDYLGSSPATRYQLLKNTFERALFDAKIRRNIEPLINTKTATGKMQAEANKLLQLLTNVTDSEDPSVYPAEARLFELYLQQEDLKKFTAGFQELSLLFGEPEAINDGNMFDPSNNTSLNSANPLHWSQYSENSLPADFKRIQERLKALDQEALSNPEVALGLKKPAKDSLFHKDNVNNFFENQETNPVPTTNSESSTAKSLSSKNLIASQLLSGIDGVTDESLDSEERKEYVIQNDDGSKETISLEDPMLLKDKTGHFWSGVVLDNDTTQKTMPGGRVMTHRCLVVVGNMRGTAGFGKGKGKNSDDALNAAFR